LHRRGNQKRAGDPSIVSVAILSQVYEVHKVPVLTKSTGPRFGRSSSQLINVTRAEPDATLFQVPSTYTITTRQGGGPGGMGAHMRGGPH
jgi:hypothetical protein